jgi:hypothetical protein
LGIGGILKKAGGRIADHCEAIEGFKDGVKLVFPTFHPGKKAVGLGEGKFFATKKHRLDQTLLSTCPVSGTEAVIHR